MLGLLFGKDMMRYISPWNPPVLSPVVGAGGGVKSSAKNASISSAVWSIPDQPRLKRPMMTWDDCLKVIRSRNILQT